MTPLSSQTGKLLTKLTGKPLNAVAMSFSAVTIATLSVAETLTGLLSRGVAMDLRRTKEALLKKLEAEVDEAGAEAGKRLAEAVAAANLAASDKYRHATAMAECRQREAYAAKTQAQAEAIRKDADTRRLCAVEKARSHLLETVIKLHQEGGQVYLNKKNLQKIIDVKLPRPKKADRELTGYRQPPTAGDNGPR